MAALDEIMAIEADVSAIEELLMTLKNKKIGFERSVTKLVELVSTAKASNIYHSNNLKHMKNVADVVDIVEFESVRTHVNNSAASLSMGINDLKFAAASLDACNLAIAESEKALTAKKKSRETGFGQILPFVRE